MEITDIKIRKIFNDEAPMKAIASVTFDNELAVHDVKVILAREKYFIVMPSRKNPDGTFRDIVPHQFRISEDSGGCCAVRLPHGAGAGSRSRKRRALRRCHTIKSPTTLCMRVVFFLRFFTPTGVMNDKNQEENAEGSDALSSAPWFLRRPCPRRKMRTTRDPEDARSDS